MHTVVTCNNNDNFVYLVYLKSDLYDDDDDDLDRYSIYNI